MRAPAPPLGPGAPRTPGISFPPTARQLALLRFIAGYQIAHGGISPSFREMAAGAGVRGKGHGAQLLRALAARGMIARLPCRQRAIEVLVPVTTPLLVERRGNKATHTPLWWVPLPLHAAPSHQPNKEPTHAHTF